LANPASILPFEVLLFESSLRGLLRQGKLWLNQAP